MVRSRKSALLQVLVDLAGYFVYRAAQDPLPGLPTLRQFHYAQGIEAIKWIRSLVD